MNLLENIKTIRALNAMSSASTAVGNEIDLAGYEGVVFTLTGSSLMEGSSNVSLKASGSTASGGTFVAYDGAAETTAMAINSFDNKILALDLHKPLKRYVKAIVAGASSDAMHTRGITAQLYNGKRPGSSDMGAGSSYVGAVATIVGATSS